MPILNLAVCAPDSEVRRPDWRWQLAKFKAAGGIVPEDWLDPLIDEAQRLYTAMQRLSDIGDRKQFAQDYFVAFLAYEIHSQSPLRRSEVEARLLAGESHDLISARCGSLAEVIETFHDLFFDVSSFLGNRDYILELILGSKELCDLTAADVDQVLKLAGYLGGPRVVDQVIRRYRNMPTMPIESPNRAGPVRASEFDRAEGRRRARPRRVVRSGSPAL